MTSTATELWQWFAHTDAGLALRIILGGSILATFGIADLRRNGRHATRWREYSFLLLAVLVALIYGVANDQITCRLSWEYFYYGKELSPVLGDRIPPDYGKLSWEATKVGLKATWTVGLLVGVFILLANNPRPGRPSLSYASLLKRMPVIVASALLCALLLGWIGSVGGLKILSEDFRQMVLHDEFRPYTFMMVYGIHLGGYIGGALGTVAAIVSILRERSQAREPRSHDDATFSRRKFNAADLH